MYLLSNTRITTQAVIAASAALAASIGGCHATDEERIRFADIPTPIILEGDDTTAYRDPAGLYHDGVFRVFHTLVERETDGRYFWYVAVTRSSDLIEWTPPRILTPRDQSLNYSSPGNVIRHEGRWLMCVQTYPTPDGGKYGDETARLWLMESDDLEHWSEPWLMRVKGPDVPVDRMGRMIDPYLVRDKDNPDRWWCFYKQNGASMSYSYDLEDWTYAGRVDAGENTCVLIDDNEYILIHSPSNGIGFKRSSDLKHWRDEGVIRLGQEDWPWAQKRLTAAHVLDLRNEPRVGKYIMFFHGSYAGGMKVFRTHGRASLALAWSDDLKEWSWPGKKGTRADRPAPPNATHSD